MGSARWSRRRDQRALMATERLTISNAAVLDKALDKVNLPTQPPAVGQPVGVLAIPALGINQAVVEGVGSSQTVSGPGHVPGTAGLGQSGNAAVVGRNAAYGGVFRRLSQLKPGDRVLTATTEGQSIYVVRHVRAVTMGSRRGADTGRGTHGHARDALPAHGRQPPDVGDVGLLHTVEQQPGHRSDGDTAWQAVRGDAPGSAQFESTGQYGRIGRLGRADPEPAGLGRDRRRCSPPVSPLHRPYCLFVEYRSARGIHRLGGRQHQPALTCLDVIRMSTIECEKCPMECQSGTRRLASRGNR